MAPILRRLRGRICRFVKLVTGDKKSRSLTNGFVGCWLGLAGQNTPDRKPPKSPKGKRIKHLGSS